MYGEYKEKIGSLDPVAVAILFVMHAIKRIIPVILICFIILHFQADGRLFSLNEITYNCLSCSSDCDICEFSKERLKSCTHLPSIGILHLRTLDIYDIGIMLFGDDIPNNLSQDGVLFAYINFGEEFGYAHISNIPHRGIAIVHISYGQSNNIDFEYLEQNLCPNCLNKILASCGKAAEDTCKNILLIDFQTMDFYPLPENLISFLRNDYYFHIDHSDTEDTVFIIYVPERE